MLVGRGACGCHTSGYVSPLELWVSGGRSRRQSVAGGGFVWATSLLKLADHQHTSQTLPSACVSVSWANTAGANGESSINATVFHVGVLTPDNPCHAQARLTPEAQFIWLVWALCTVLEHGTIPWPWHSWKRCTLAEQSSLGMSTVII